MHWRIEMQELIESIFNASSYLWSGPVLMMLIFVGLYQTVALKGIQFKYLGYALQLVLSAKKESKTTNFEGLYQIDEDRLYDLDDQTLQILHKKRALSIAYCQVISRINFGKIQERVADLLKMEKQQSEIQSEIGSFVSDNEKFGF